MKVLVLENGAPGDSDGLKVMPGFAGVSCRGALKFAASTTMMTNNPVARKIFTIPLLSTGGCALVVD